MSVLLERVARRHHQRQDHPGECLPHHHCCHQGDQCHDVDGDASFTQPGNREHHQIHHDDARRHRPDRDGKFIGAGHPAERTHHQRDGHQGQQRAASSRQGSGHGTSLTGRAGAGKSPWSPSDPVVGLWSSWE